MDFDKAFSIVNPTAGQFALTDLTKTKLPGVESAFFRFFQPVKFERMRLPTSLPEFRALRYSATLSDSPLTASAKLGGHWTDHNLAAIFHVAACNFRCSYCYVEFEHLGGKDAMVATAEDVVDDFQRLRQKVAGRLSIIRMSGGEPLLAPELLIGIHGVLRSRGLLDETMLKIESNLSVLGRSTAQFNDDQHAALREAARDIVMHVTIHSKPNQKDWRDILGGLALAVKIGFDVYPAIGGADWSEKDMAILFDSLVGIHQNMPSRLAVRPFNLEYDVVAARRLDEGPQIDSKRSAIEVWNELLRNRSDSSYLNLPRHRIPLDS